MTTLVHILLGGLGLLVLAFIGYMVVRMVRRKILNQDEPSTAVGFTMLDFKRMYERGELTAEEYQRVKGKYAARMKQNFLPPDSDDDSGAAPAEQEKNGA